MLSILSETLIGRLAEHIKNSNSEARLDSIEHGDRAKDSQLAEHTLKADSNIELSTLANNQEDFDPDSKKTNPFQKHLSPKQLEASMSSLIEKLTGMSNSSRELKLDKLGKDIVARLLEHKESFSPDNYDKLDTNGKITLLRDLYNIYMDELCIPQISRIPLTLDKLPGRMLGEYSYDTDFNASGGIRLSNEKLVISSDLLQNGSYWEAARALLHESVHKLQSYMSFCDTKLFPYKEMRKDISNSMFNAPKDLWEYYFNPPEINAYQTADYIIKVYQEIFYRK